MAELSPLRSAEAVRQRVEALGPWFHNMTLCGVQTAPSHFLGDFPRVKWDSLKAAIPPDLSGRSVLDIGCNGGFYSMEMKRRGADRVLGVDIDDTYLAQARFAAEIEGLDIEYRRLSVYDVATLQERFDLVLFMGVFYHLRHPLLALDLLHEHVTRDILVFQALQRGDAGVEAVAPDYDITDVAHFDAPSYPKMHFIEYAYSHDDTNWWLPNHACSAALLRSAGFEIIGHPEEEIFICRHSAEKDRRFGAVYPSRVSPPGRSHD